LQPTRRTLRRFSGHDTRGSLERYTPYIEAFQRGLREWGYVKIRNIIIEYRIAESGGNRLARAAAEFDRLPVDIIVVGGPTL